MDNFTSLTRELNATLNKATRKEHGIFFTPKSFRQQVIKYVKNICSPKSILEPSFGSGEFISDCLSTFPDASITGVELNTDMFNRVNDYFQEMRQISLFNEDFLKFNHETPFDLIIGNPPYVVVATGTPEEFKPVTTGRPNLYCWFIYKSIKMLVKDGILAFVIPNSILNTSYYELLRKYIIENCEILNIIEFDKSDFQETDQTTIALIVKKHVSNSTKYIVHHKGHIVFSVHSEYINKQLSTYPNLKELGVSVKTGTVVWNQNKQHLKDDATVGKLLIYASNVKQGRFMPFEGTPRNGKKQYIDLTKPTMTGPLILLNRGYGNSTYVLDMLLIEGDVAGQREFYVENHLNVIYPTNDKARALIKGIYTYLKSDKSIEYVSKFVGNGAMSKTEIETMLPICL